MEINNLDVIEKKAKYGFSISKELEKNIEFLEDEKIETIVNKKGETEKCQFRGFVFEEKIFQHPSIIILTNKRLIFLKHYFFSLINYFIYH